MHVYTYIHSFAFSLHNDAAFNTLYYLILQQDAFANVLLGIFFLGGAASSASYSSQWNEPPLVCEDAFIDELGQPSFSCDEEILGGQLAALAVRI